MFVDVYMYICVHVLQSEAHWSKFPSIIYKFIFYMYSVLADQLPEIALIPSAWMESYSATRFSISLRGLIHTTLFTNTVVMLCIHVNVMQVTYVCVLITCSHILSNAADQRANPPAAFFI